MSNESTPNSSEYIDICNCDVEDKEKLALYRKKRSQWIQWLHGDKLHSIEAQIGEMLWDDALYRTIIQIPENNPDNDKPDIGYNFPFINLFVRNFFENQSLKIRRLVEPLKEQSSKSIISLRALIEDIENNISLITRENFVCYNGFKYDIAELKQRFRDEQARKGKKGGTVPVELWHPPEMHKDFDKLSDKDNRSRLDTIDSAKIKRLNKFKECQDIQTFTNKFIAHAAAPENREHLNLDEISPSLDKFDSCYKELAKAAKGIKEVLWDGIAFQVPTPQGFDLLSHLEKPMIHKADIPKLRDYWNQRKQEIEKLS